MSPMLRKLVSRVLNFVTNWFMRTTIVPSVSVVALVACVVMFAACTTAVPP
jgi:hypothetical protein